MIRKSCNKTEIEGLNRILGQEKRRYDLWNILDLLPQTVLIVDDSGECSYHIVFKPGCRQGKMSEWELAYEKNPSQAEDSDFSECPDTLCSFGDEQGLFEAAMKMFYWVYEYTGTMHYNGPLNECRRLIVSHDEKRIAQSIDDALNTYAMHREEKMDY